MAKQYLDKAAKENGFLNVVFTDKTSVQLETYTWFCCRKCGELLNNKPRYSTNHVDILLQSHLCVLYIYIQCTCRLRYRVCALHVHVPSVYLSIQTIFVSIISFCSTFPQSQTPSESVQVYIWGGISRRGRTGLCV